MAIALVTNYFYEIGDVSPAYAQVVRDKVTIIDGSKFANGISGDEIKKSLTVGAEPLGIAVNQKTDKWCVAVEAAGTVVLGKGSNNKNLVGIVTGPSNHGADWDQLKNVCYVTNTNQDAVIAIDGKTNTIKATIPVGPDPIEVAVNEKTCRVYTANQGDSTVSAINCATNQVIATFSIGVGASLKAIACNETTNKCYVTDTNADSVIVIDTTKIEDNIPKNEVIATILVGLDPFDVAVNERTCRVYTANEGDGTVSAINCATNQVIETVSIVVGPSNHVLVVDPTRNRVIVGNTNVDQLIVLCGSCIENGIVNDEIIDTIPAIDPLGITFNDRTNTYYVTTYL